MQLVCALLFVCWSAVAAENPFIGRWKIDMADSRADPAGPGIIASVVEYTVENGVLIGRAWAADGSARPVVARYDGQEHAYPNKTMYTTAVNTADGATLGTVFKKDGKVVGSRKITLSRDGRAMTVELNGTTVDGRKLQSMLVYERTAE